jgi:3-oxoacyl-[acyl-carrier protein] reductase
MRFEGTVVLVTGSGRGLGRHLALGFAREGADVVVNYSRSEAGARETAAEIVALGRRCLAVRADVTVPSDVGAMVEAAIGQFGKIDVLVNNAAVVRDGPVWKLSESDWDTVLDSCLKSVFVCTKAVAPQMRKRGYGRIVNISSSGAQLGIFGTGAYAAAKAGIGGFSRCAARELAPAGVTVNSLLLGYIEVGLYEQYPREAFASTLAQVPLGRVGQPEEAVEAALFLASKSASYITGQELGVNGGLYM